MSPPDHVHAARQHGAPAAGVRRAVALASAGVVVLLSGCLSTPMPALAPDVPTAWQEGRDATGVPIDLQAWWHAFGSRDLDTLVDAALRDEPGLQGAHARLGAARILAPHATDLLRPNVRALTNDQIDPDASASFFVAGFDATWELGLFGRGEATRRLSSAALATASADDAAARVSLVAEVARAWVQLGAAQQRCKVLDAMLAARTAQAALVDKRIALGLAPVADRLAARTDIADGNIERAAASQQAVAWRHALAALVGRSEPDPAWDAQDAVPTLGALDVETLPADLLRARPDLRRAQADVLAAAGALGMARADRFPRIGLGGSLHWSTNLTAHRDTPGNDAIAGFGPEIEIPLFDWGLRAAQARAKSEELRASVFAYRAAVLAAVAEVETNLSGVHQDHARVAGATQAESDAVAAAHAVQLREQLRLASRIEVLDASVKLLQRQLDRVDAASAEDLSYVALFKALGGASLPPDPSVAGGKRHAGDAG